VTDVFAWLRAGAEREIETSCAWVFLLPDKALKLKKPVDFGFLDFTTLEKRHWALERELRFNRTTAPDIYRDLVPISRAPDGTLRLGSGGEVVEWALEMRRFDPDGVLSAHPERVDAGLAEALGRTVARFHAAAQVRPDGGGVKALGYTIRSNAEQLRRLADRFGAEEVERLIAATDAAFERAAPLLERRRAEGFARRCHGDLHLANILLEDGIPRLFDCIEFNDRLSEIDVFYDLAFLLMDLGFRGNGAGANRALNAYLDEAARAFPSCLWDGLAALPLMLSARATVRAHVSTHQGEPIAGADYLAAAARHLAPPPPRLLAVGGLSGSGKTTLARKVAPRLGAAPGAVVLRSDEIRKRLAGVGPLERLAKDAYTPAMSERVYGEMLALARRVLAAGHSAILDAVFLRPDERRAAETLARDLSAPFEGIWLSGAPPMLTARLAARTGDASDADAQVLREQLRRDPGPMDWVVVDAGDPAAAAQVAGVAAED
jgi:aminoglycoside phosphotransferase family enzyme/predicted kinase